LGHSSTLQPCDARYVAFPPPLCSLFTAPRHPLPISPCLPFPLSWGRRGVATPPTPRRGLRIHFLFYSIVFSPSVLIWWQLFRARRCTPLVSSRFFFRLARVAQHPRSFGRRGPFSVVCDGDCSPVSFLLEFSFLFLPGFRFRPQDSSSRLRGDHSPKRRPSRKGF